MAKPTLSAAGARVKAVYEERWGTEINDEDAEALAQAARAKPERSPTTLQQVTGDILEVCGWTGVMYGRAAKMAKKLIADGVKPGDILLHYGREDPGPDVWWWRRPGQDFRKSLTDAIIAETRGKWEEKQEILDVNEIEKRSGRAGEKAQGGRRTVSGSGNRAPAGAGANPRQVMLAVPDSLGAAADAGWA